MGLEGQIVFKVLMDETGNYVKHLPPESGHAILISAVENHLCNMKFTPAICEGKPIRFWVNVPFRFKLK